MKEMKVKLKVVHSIAGRARIKVDSGFDPKVFFIVLEVGLREIEEIKRAEVNPFSQTITVFFRRDNDLGMILQEMRRIFTDITNDSEFSQRLEDIKDALTCGDKGTMDIFVRDKIIRVSRNLDHTVRHITGNTVDMRTAVPVSSFVSGIAALILAPAWATPAWLVLLTFGITSFHLLKNDDRNVIASVNRSLPEGKSAEKMELLAEGPRLPA